MADDRKNPEDGAGHWQDLQNPAWRRFPGPETSGDLMRVTLDREAFAEIALHAKENLDREVCGVLVGECCNDESGLYVHVKDVIRGTTSEQSDRHVTFTHETWDEIHRALNTLHPDRFIVGWYHSHPGFGVVFSEMDRFIQSNFFPGTGQVALVTDPLGGAFNLCVNSEGQVLNLKRFWVDGQEHRCGGQDTSTTEETAAVSADMVRDLEVKLERVLITLDKQKIQFERFLLSLLVIVFVLCLGLLGWSIYERQFKRWKPPEILTKLPVPILAGDTPIMLGIGIYGWEIPEDLIGKRPPAQQAPADTADAAGMQPTPNPDRGAR